MRTSIPASTRAKGVVAPFHEKLEKRVGSSSLQVATCILVKDCNSIETL